MNYTEIGTYTYNGEDVEYHYSSSATYSEQITFVNAVTNIVVNEYNYISLLKGVAFNYALVTMFTDIDGIIFKDENGEADIDIFDKFDNETGVSDFLKSVIDSKIITALNSSLDDNIAYKTGIHRDLISMAVVDLIKTLENKINDFSSNLGNNELIDFVKKFNAEDMNSESIVKSYLDSNTYKKNVAEVVNNKNREIRELKEKINSITAKNVMSDKKDKKNK